jgi:hypothetical protein
MTGQNYSQAVTIVRHFKHLIFWQGNLLFPMKSALTSGGVQMAQRKQKDWRELCAAVAHETDSNKLGSLVQELIKALDEREQNWRSPLDPFRDSRAVACTN